MIDTIASELRRAAESGEAIPPIASRLGERDLRAAYAVQRVNVDRSVIAGDRIVGRKVGLTSKAVQQQLGVSEPDFGTLLASMELTDGDRFTRKLLQPKVEAEVAFVLARDLDGLNLTLTEVASAVAYAVPAIEIVDSRIADWKIAIVDTVADNASSAAYVLGTEARSLDALDLRSCGMVLEKNGEITSLGVGAACLGHPLRAALWLARTLVEHETPLRAGDVVLSGALGPMVPVALGDHFRATIGGLGTVSVRF